MKREKRFGFLVFALVSALTGAGCRYDDAGVAGPDAARDRLARAPERLALQPAACFLEVNDRALPLRGGSIEVETDLAGTLTLRAAEIRLGDVVVPASDEVPVELRFTDVVITLAEPIAGATEWSAAGDAGFARVTADVLLDWKLIAPNGDVLPLATQRLRDLELDVDVFDALDGRLTATVYGEREGTFWSWAGLLDLSDLTVDLRASAQ